MLISTGSWLPVKPVFAANQGVLINEIQAGSKASGTEEFIELLNDNAVAVDLAGWKIQYFSASATSYSGPTRTINLSGQLGPSALYLIASTNYLAGLANVSYSATLSQTGGHLRLLDSTAQERDFVGWGNASMVGASAASALPAGLVLARDNAPNFIISGDNSKDFVVSISPTPAQLNIIQSPGSGVGNNMPAASIVVDPNAAELYLNEILPDPAAPASDSSDEFVEIFNPTNTAIELSGFKLTSGNNESYKFVLGSSSINGGEYLVIYSRNSHLTLSNSGGQVKLYDSLGNLIDQTAVYPKAQTGQAWAKFGSAWQWTTTPTPQAANQLTTLAPKASTGSKSVGSKTTKASSAKQSSAKKSSTTKSPKDSGQPKNTFASVATDTKNAGTHLLALAVVALLALLYAGYEYRADITNRYRQFRQNHSFRRSNRKEPPDPSHD